MDGKGKNKMIKESGRMFDKNSPADRAALDELKDRLEEEEVIEDLAHLQDTIKKIEESLEIIKTRNFNEMDQKELAEVGEVVANLGRFKTELNMLVDDYLGQGALVHANLPDDMIPSPPKDFVGWGSRKPGDPEFGLSHPTIPLAEASAENEIIKKSTNPWTWASHASVLKSLVRVANDLDSRGLVADAGSLDQILLKMNNH